MINILYSGNEFDSPSRAARAITGGQVNGWKFWNVKDAHGEPKGSLWDLRQRLVLDEVPEAVD